MTQEERRDLLLCRLLEERGEPPVLPVAAEDRRRLLRGLMNLRPPRPAGEDFLRVQNEYLREEIARRGITDIRDLTPVAEGLYLWRGDITTLRCDAIVNAANSGMLGCFCPCHGCIDNAIHTFAGVQLRELCARLMAEQGHQEETGGAKLTPAFNLPCRYILHTVGPIVTGAVTPRDEALLAHCYRSCLELAAKNGIKSIALCCISTGEFGFPNRPAAEIAIRTVKQHRAETKQEIKVIFNVFKDIDHRIYRELLGGG